MEVDKLPQFAVAPIFCHGTCQMELVTFFSLFFFSAIPASPGSLYPRQEEVKEIHLEVRGLAGLLRPVEVDASISIQEPRGFGFGRGRVLLT